MNLISSEFFKTIGATINKTRRAIAQDATTSLLETILRSENAIH